MFFPFYFADKVFRELFCGGTSALLVDADGAEWDCLVACETRNDMRLQYTLRGQFHDYWDAVGVKAGDVLTFERNTPSFGKIRVKRYPQGRGLEDALDEAGGGTTSGGLNPSRNATVAGEIMNISTHRGGGRATSIAEALPSGPSSTGHGKQPQQLRSQLSSRGLDLGDGPPLYNGAGHSSHGLSAREVGEKGGSSGHPNRWTELSDGSAAKTVYKSTLVHQQCPIAGWLFRKLYGRVPADADSAPMHDPVLASDYVFEVNFVPAANVHYITGRGFGAWIKESGLRSGDQIRVWRDNTGVKLCKMAPGQDLGISTQAAAAPIERKWRATLSSRDLADLPPGSSGVLLPPFGGAVPAVPAGFSNNPSAAPPTTGLVSPPSAQALAALNALAAAAGYARQHGTPAIQAVLSHAAALRDQGLPVVAEVLGERLTAAGVAPPPSPFARKRKAPCSDTNEQEGDSVGVLGGGPGITNSAAIVGLRGGAGEDLAIAPKDPLSIGQPVPRSIEALPRPPPPPGLPGQLQLQHALQQLLQQYHAQAHTQPPNSRGQTQTQTQTVVPSQPAPLTPPFHPAPPILSSQDPRDPSNATQPLGVDSSRQQSRGSAAFAAVMAALGRHQWTQTEATLIVQFRAKCGKFLRSRSGQLTEPNHILFYSSNCNLISFSFYFIHMQLYWILLVVRWLS